MQQFLSTQHVNNDADSDAELVARFKGGDRAAFTELVYRHQDRIYRLALVLLHDRQGAADAAQEVFLRAYTGLVRFRFHAEPFTWLFRTTKNVCREHNRKRRFQPLESEPEAESATAGREWDEAHCQRVIRTQVGSLPERQRDVVMLRFFEELSTQDTARAMGCRPGTVKALLHKAVQRLRANTELATLGESLALRLEEES